MRALPVRRIAFGALCAVLLVGVTGPTALAADSAGGRSQVASPGTPLVQIRNSDVRRDELTPVVDLLTAVTRADDGRLSAAETRTLGKAAKDALKEAEAKQQATRAMPFASAPAPGVLLPMAETDPMGDALDALWDAVDRLLDLFLPGDDAIGDATEEEAADEETTDANTGANTDVVDDETTEEIDEILGESADGADDAVDDAADPTLSWLDDLLTEMGKLIDELSAGDPQVSVVTTQTTPSTTTSSSVASSSITLLTPSPSTSPAVPAATSPVVTLPATTPPAPAAVLSAD
ncbi:hypothetical protein DIZ27_16485 [Streptomyces sp. NWU339]|uniref:hypothetical protein n=1 Tax=Streptomyces sp. NWU339 TaxID=2185284 RepID=UPI000D67986E|nr:hypothetical protein [Streptomyces sp. NWU339]PWI09666.1 hypothetical protein DIZ27_16485 [Streptomyces sp. NWU339]